ncbi:SRPBCC family protein [Cellulomonas chengniuliangii]|uniref:SRPBCC family protein n=1 Tax=Cellulomonas chengniuliangii TaxID=2968084 RepID=A0ABY5KYQ6_9CELL|nr:SRPBCC family protein [Cellulomonas chengniuliangii]MCC2307953.1 SRPBCC family protein [Cellulomonas chengniuliangii]MCC2318473.1 SRPBCC family protein [Cellulomonas chengniuliangii]UUI75299.1 SRPBCC family protein [Cellulomonas chengniuliangii]
MIRTATMRALDPTAGAVRVEDVYDTDIDDLWDACTTPERLARWIAQVTGDPRLDGSIEMTFTSAWTCTARIEECDAPRHLLVSTSAPEGGEAAQIEAWLTPEGDRTRLVIEERGLPLAGLHFHGAGWQTHLEDLRRSLQLDGTAHPEGWSATAPSPDWSRRSSELNPAYEAVDVSLPPAASA